MQFMAYNTIAYADVSLPGMSAATSTYLEAFRQMALTLGIALSAAAAASLAITRPYPADACQISPRPFYAQCGGVIGALRGDAVDRGEELSGHQVQGAAVALMGRM